MSRLFSQVVGHKSKVADLLTALKNERLASTLLFTGPQGIGKKQVALGLAQALVCEKSREACGRCPSCLRIAKKESESLLFLSPQGTQIKMDQAREVLRFLSLQLVGPARVVIIEQAELLNVQAANALLKTLEEPPAGSYIILLATSVTSVLPTIRSRCQVQRFAALTREELKQLTSAEDWIIEAAQGRADLVEQLRGENLQELRRDSFSLLEALLDGQSMGERLNFMKELVKNKEQSLSVVRFWQQILRDSRYYKEGLEPLIHRDFFSLIEAFAHQKRELVDELALHCHQLEKDILGNLDRSLAFEKFYRQAQGQLYVG